MQCDNLDMDSKLLGDCLMSLAVFEAWQEPLYTHIVAQARSQPLSAYGMRSLRQTYQVSQSCDSTVKSADTRTAGSHIAFSALAVF